MAASAVLVVLIATLGTGLTFWTGVGLRLEERIPLGIVCGVIAFSASTFVAFELIGMGWGAVAVGVALPGAPAAAGWRRGWAGFGAEVRLARQRAGRPWRHASSLRPLLLLTAASGAVATRTMALAYQRTPQGVSVGSLSGWGDWAAHLAYAGSFAHGDNRGLDLPLAAGTPLRYHFLSDFFGATFTVTGLDLARGLVWSTWLLALVIPPLLFTSIRRLTGSRLSSGLAVLLFLLSGGWGAWYFVQDVRRDGWGVITHLPRTYARLPELGIWLDNTTSASLYAQRSTQMGLAAAFGAALLLLAARPAWRRGGFVAAGLLVGATGLIHVHTLFTALALGTLALLADRRAVWLWFLGPAAALGLPLAYTLLPPTSSLRWLPGWMADEAGQPWPWFWLRNAGLLLPLFLAVSVLGGVPRRISRLTMPLWLWFVAANLVAFHPWAGNNTKFFLFWQLAGCVAVAELLRRAWVGPIRRRGALPRAIAGGAALLVTASMLVTGGLDVVRAMQRSSAIPWVSQDDLAAARWLRQDASPGEVLVYGAHNTSAVAALSGVAAVSGYPGWTVDLGLPDWGRRVEASRSILSGAPDALQLVERYGVDYVVIGPRERADMAASDAFWDRHGTLLFRQGEQRIYGVDPDS